MWVPGNETSVGHLACAGMTILHGQCVAGDLWLLLSYFPLQIPNQSHLDVMVAAVKKIRAHG